MIPKLLVAMLVCTSLAAAPKKSDLAVYLASEFDAATTYYDLHTCPTCREANPLFRPVAGNAAAFAVAGVTAWAINKESAHLAEHGHPKVAKFLKVAVIAVHVTAGISNLRH